MRRRLLLVFPDHPHPLDMGSRVRNFRIAETLARSFDLIVVSQLHDRRHLAEPGPLAGFGRWVPVLAPHRRDPLERARRHLEARWVAWRAGLHRETFFQSLPALSRTVESLLPEVAPDLVHAAYWYGLRHLRRFPRPPLWVVDTHDVQFDRHHRLWNRTSAKERDAELRELRRYDRIIAITERDREMFRRALGDRPPCEVVGMGPDLETWVPEGERALVEAPRVAFFGNLTNPHNAAAARDLVRDLAPALGSRVPGLELLVLGAGPPEDVCRHASDRPPIVRVPGFVEDVRPWLRSARVVALPLRAGSGQRGRVLECLAVGVPVVGYPGGLEGLELEDGDGIRVAGDEREMVDVVAELASDPTAARLLGERGRARVAERYGHEATYGKFSRLYTQWLDESAGAFGLEADTRGGTEGETAPPR